MKTYSIEEMTHALQAMSVSELNNSTTFLFENKQEIEYTEEQINPEIEAMTYFLQNSKLEDLKNLPTQTLDMELSIEQKITITGLEKWKILRIESQKEDATLKEIITYCDRLKIPYQSFIPELFAQQQFLRR